MTCPHMFVRLNGIHENLFVVVLEMHEIREHAVDLEAQPRLCD